MDRLVGFQEFHEMVKHSFGHILGSSMLTTYKISQEPISSS